MNHKNYDPTASRVAENTLADFLRAPLTGDLKEVPGIGRAYVIKLRQGEDGDRVENTFQLFGKFLLFKVRLFSRLLSISGSGGLHRNGEVLAVQCGDHGNYRRTRTTATMG